MERLNNCSICGRRYSCVGNLNRHINDVHRRDTNDQTRRNAGSSDAAKRSRKRWYERNKHSIALNRRREKLSIRAMIEIFQSRIVKLIDGRYSNEWPKKPERPDHILVSGSSESAKLARQHYKKLKNFYETKLKNFKRNIVNINESELNAKVTQYLMEFNVDQADAGAEYTSDGENEIDSNEEE